jgi:hypothetical protein
MEAISMNVELLYQTIREETQKYMELVDMCGKDHPMAKRVCAQICGMQKAFKIITGVSYTDYLLAKLS